MVLGYGGWLVLQHRLTPGDVLMFIAYLDRCFTPVDSLNRAIRLRGEGPVEAPGADFAPGPGPGPGRVEVRDVCFSYVPEREVLKGLNLTLAPAKTTVLAGPSGAVKTTTSDLLLKIFEPTAGQIFIDGHNIANSGPAPVRRGTLAENIRYHGPMRLPESALSVGFARLLERLPVGLETEIGENGVGLCQRLQIRPPPRRQDSPPRSQRSHRQPRLRHRAPQPRPTTLIICR